MSDDSRDRDNPESRSRADEQEAIEWDLAARAGHAGTGGKSGWRSFAFAILVMALTPVACGLIAWLVFPNFSSEKVGELSFHLALITGAIAYFGYEWLAAKTRRPNDRPGSGRV